MRPGSSAKSGFRAAISAAGLLALCAVAAVANAPKYKIGDNIANFSLKDDSGRTVTLSQYRGKIIVLNFYASW